MSGSSAERGPQEFASPPPRDAGSPTQPNAGADPNSWLQDLGGWPHLRPGMDGGARPPNGRRMPGRQGRGCSRGECRAGGGAGSAASAKVPAAAAPPGPRRRLLPAPPRSPAAAAESGRRRRQRRQIPGSAIPHCPGWGETAAAHFLGNAAPRPTSLATAVNFNNFIGIRPADRESLPGRAGRGWVLAPER